MAATLDTGAHEELFFNDDLPVDEQRQFDNNVLVELDELKKPSLHLLLFYITNVGDTRLTHLTLRRAKALISDKPFLEEILQRSLEIRSFQQVQRLKILRPPDLHESLALEVECQRLAISPEQRRTQLEASFCGDYRGDNAQIFLQALGVYDKIYDSSLYYGRSIPILQSSGTGKSRLVAEVLKNTLGLSICFRDSNSPEASWPPRDEAMCRFVNSVEYLGEEMAAALVGALFKQVYERLGRNPNDDLETQMSAWSYKSVSRGVSFESVFEAANRSLATMPDDLVARRQRIIEEEDLDEIDEWYKVLYRHVCLEATKILGIDFQRLGHDKFIVAFDECTNIISRSSMLKLAVETRSKFLSPAYGMSILALQRMIKAQDEFPIEGFGFWFFFLDTGPTIAEFFHPCREALLTRHPDLTTLPPWPYLGFDVMVYSPARTPREALSFSYLKNYGRPYWSTYAATNFLSAARRKLYMCSRSPYLNPIDVDHVLATFPQRFPVELAANKAGSILAASGVRSHMRIQRDIVGRSHIETVAPSEPALAIAAMKELMTSRETYKRALETFVDNLTINGSILKRSRQAELFSCILLTLARDWASAFKNIQQVPTISSKVFLTTLLGENLGLPPNDQRLQFLNEMDNAHINFTHIVQLTEDVDNLSFDFLCKAWCRGAAFQCKSQQPCIDGFIVTYSGALDDPFELKWFNYIAWRSELRVDASTSGLTLGLAGPRIEGQRPQSAVVLFMDLGTNCGFGSTKGKLCQLTLGPAQHPHVPSHGWGGYMPTQDEEPPRWCIHARGHTYATYPVTEGVSLQFTALFNQSSPWMDRALSDKMGEEVNPFVMQLDPRKGLAETPGSKVK